MAGSEKLPILIDPPPPPAVPKAATKSKALHRWRQEQLKKKR